MDSIKAGEQLIPWRAGSVRRYKLFVQVVTGLIMSREYNANTTLSGIQAMVMLHLKFIPIHYTIVVNPFAKNAVKTAQICSCWYEEIARMDPAQGNTDLPRAYISAVNESSKLLIPSLT